MINCMGMEFSKRFDPDPQHDYMDEYRNRKSTFNYRRMLGWLDCEHLQTEVKRIERENMIEEYGKNSAIVRSMLYGLFQRSEDFNLIYTDRDLELMKAAMRGDNEPIGSDVAAAGDISGGGDGQILNIRIGTEINLHDDHNCGTGIEQADYWVALLNKIGIQPWKFNMDTAGLGAEVANYMEMRLGFKGIRRIEANVGPRFKFEFRDKYTEIHFLVKELLSANVLKLPYSENLLKQMRCRRFIEMESGHKIKTEDKKAHRKREKGSPDELDDLVYVFWDFDPYLLATHNEIKESVDEDALTPMEKKAAMTKLGGTKAFSNLRGVEHQRESFAADVRLRGLRIGR